MSEAVVKSSRSAVANGVIPRLFVLELNAGCIHAMNTDGSDRKTVVTHCHLPDGIVVDVEAGHIYWTNMGVPNLNDGSIERADLDGKESQDRSSRRGTPTPPSRSFSIRRAASSTGATARACASCAAISTARKSRRWSKRAVVIPIGRTRRNGASG